MHFSVALPASGDTFILASSALIFGFVCGAIPFGYVAGRLRGIDIRSTGSGNIGFTNVARVLGWPYAVPVLILDFAKGLIPVVLTARLVQGHLSQPADLLVLLRLFGPGLVSLRVLVGLGAILGHTFTPVLRFRGGKGVATTAGVIAALSPSAFAVCVAVFVMVLGITRYLSLASMSAALVLPISTLALLPGQWVVSVFTAIVALLILLRHTANIRRLCRGQEPRFRIRPDSPPKGAEDD